MSWVSIESFATMNACFDIVKRTEKNVFARSKNQINHPFSEVNLLKKLAIFNSTNGFCAIRMQLPQQS